MAEQEEASDVSAAAMACPGCGARMKRDCEPDISVDKCLRCRGVFLDRGELNVLATGAAGDIEYSPVDAPLYAERFPVRDCPKCAGSRMRKVRLLRIPDLVFDLCPECSGFYLDRGECEAMNAALREQTPDAAAQEFRGERAGRLVRIDRVDEVVEVLVEDIERMVGSSHVGISVYFRAPLAADLRILEHKWTTLLARLFGLVTAQRIRTGNEAFDRVFTVHSASRKEALDVLTPGFLALMAVFADERPSVFGLPGEVTVSRVAIGYREGPYPPETTTGMVERSREVVDRLIGLAGLIDR